MDSASPIFRAVSPASPPPPAESASLLERAFQDALLLPDESVMGTEIDETRVRLLDAAYEQFCRTGIQRSSMEEIARRAKLSRITLYRKFESKDALVDEVILREFRRYFLRFLEDIAQADTVADRVVLGFVSALRVIRTNRLIGNLLETEPVLFAGAIGGDDGTMLAAVRRFVAGQLQREQRAGTVAADLNTDLVAEMLVRISRRSSPHRARSSTSTTTRLSPRSPGSSSFRWCCRTTVRRDSTGLLRPIAYAVLPAPAAAPCAVSSRRPPRRSSAHRRPPGS